MGGVLGSKTAYIYFPAIPNQEDIKRIGKLYHRFYSPNKNTDEYFQNEYNNLIRGKRVLGVLCRGTDYVVTKPKGHPIQPDIDELIDKVRIEKERLECEAIYLATEEYAIQKKFEESFPNEIIVNKRHYFDSYYDLYTDNNRVLISAVDTGRTNDSYYKSLEYLSSVYLLSRCYALVAGNCGGSRAALYMNNGEYEYSYLFNKGFYE